MLLIGEHVIADLTAFRMELLGYQTVSPSTLSEATTTIAKRPPSLVMLDTKFADEDGVAFLVKLRREYDPVMVPVLIVTLDPSLDTVRMAYQSGAQDYLISPFDPTVLEAKVNRLLTGQNARETSTQNGARHHATTG